MNCECNQCKVKELEAKLEESESRFKAERLDVLYMDKKLAIAVEALEEIANEDFRGNRPSGCVKAFNALKKIKGNL